MGPVSVPIIVMGVAGCGKSTVGSLLADRLGQPYSEADDFHPAGNITKMARGGCRSTMPIGCPGCRRSAVGSLSSAVTWSYRARPCDAAIETCCGKPTLGPCS